FVFFFFQAEDGIRDYKVTGVQTCALPISDGVHVGQGDAPFAEARRTAGEERIVGLSATTSEELQGDPDYFGVGAIFGTPTKPERSEERRVGKECRCRWAPYH